jgi:hypothetical protein
MKIMIKLLKNRIALSTVVTTLIILVVSVLLATVVVYYATNVVSTRVQEESLHLTKQHIWYDTTNSNGQAAIMIINTGGRDVVLDKITCRGQEAAWSSVFYNITTDAISADLTYDASMADAYNMTGFAAAGYVFAVASTDITLKSGYTAIIYVDDPDSVSMNDIGLTVALTVFTSQAMHYKETNVEAVVA